MTPKEGMILFCIMRESSNNDHVLWLPTPLPAAHLGAKLVYGSVVTDFSAIDGEILVARQGPHMFFLWGDRHLPLV